ncbi:MAG: hypothetical protein L0Z50_10190 [Verrucomicrobiales bacterium]|nr:hypothetical protein [Verrucomicrobiales bacterium]
MKIFAALFVCCLAGLTGAMAQIVSVEVMLDREQYLVNEELVAKVRITNFSGQTLTLGDDDDWLSFTLEGGPAKVVSQRALVPVRLPFKLDSGKIGTRRIDIAPYFDLSRPGRFTVAASVRLPQLNIRVPSKPVSFNIITGTVLWQQDFGMPVDSKLPNSTPEIRKYALLQVTHEKDLKLYFRLTDGSGTRSLRVFPIDKLISFSNPEGQLDRFNNLHVLYQMGAHSFLYTVINPEGVLLGRETHDISPTSRPGLRADKDGRISVVGGVRRYPSTDLPPPDSIPSDAASRQR